MIAGTRPAQIIQGPGDELPEPAVGFVFGSGEKVVLYKQSSCADRLVIDRLARAVRPVLESLEERRLMAVDTVQDLPFTLEFDADRGEILDKDGEGTGLTFVAPNKNNNQYQPNLIDLDILTGHL